MIVGRCPQAMVAARNPAISMFSLVVNKAGICMGSVSIKAGRLKSRYFSSRKDFIGSGARGINV
jgi:hypothetical protein